MPRKSKNRITSAHFQLRRNQAGQWWLHALDRNVAPKGRRVTASDARYLFECANSLRGDGKRGVAFDAACVWDYGVGIWQARRRKSKFRYN